MERTLERQKEGWAGVLLTAIGCAAFLIWWFWPQDSDRAMGKAPTPINFLAAAVDANGKGESLDFDRGVLVLALQANTKGDALLVQHCIDAMQSTVVKGWVKYAVTERPETEEGFQTSELSALLENGELDQAIARMTDEKSIVEIAEFLTRGGDFEMAQGLIKRLPERTALSTEILCDLAQLEASWGHFDASDATLDAAVSRKSEAGEAIMVASSAFKLNAFSVAEEAMKSAVLRAAGATSDLKRLADAYLEFGLLKEARDTASSAFSQADVDDAAVWEVRLRLLERQSFEGTVVLASEVADSPEIADAIQVFCESELKALELPSIVWDDNLDNANELKGMVGENQEGDAAAIIEKIVDGKERALAYLALARLVVWRGGR